MKLVKAVYTIKKQSLSVQAKPENISVTLLPLNACLQITESLKIC